MLFPTKKNENNVNSLGLTPTGSTWVARASTVTAALGVPLTPTVGRSGRARVEEEEEEEEEEAVVVEEEEETDKQEEATIGKLVEEEVAEVAEAAAEGEVSIANKCAFKL